MKTLRHLSALLLFSVLMTASCYAPVNPDIFGVLTQGKPEDSVWWVVWLGRSPPKE